MEGEYRFKVKTCPSCKCLLADKTSSVVGFYRDVIPMGACPKCGKQSRLDASPEDSKVTLDYEVVMETGAATPTPVSKTPIRPKAEASAHAGTRWPGVGQQYTAGVPTDPAGRRVASKKRKRK